MIRGLFVSLAMLAACTHSSPRPLVARPELPAAALRTYGVNYKDMMLAVCIETAYKAAPVAAQDARDTAGALTEWTRYDVESATAVDEKIIDRYLARTYRGKEDPNVRLDLLKCLDMYHSPELETRMRQYVDRPSATYATEQQEN